MQLKRLLYMCEYPPSSTGGAPIIARQFLRLYDRDRLHVLCDRRQHEIALRSGQETLLDCPHTTISNLEPLELRPRRVFGAISDVINLLRVPWIVRTAERIIDREAIDALFAIPWRTEFALAAFIVSRRRNLPLYLFETDDWQAMNRGPLVRHVTSRYHHRLLTSAEHLWMTSPGMIRRYRDRFGVEGEFLFHFVDEDDYANAPPREAAVPGEIRMVYTGAVNYMFLGALERICDWLNEGVEIEGRRLVLDIWSGWFPEQLRGPAVRHRGFVPSDEVPGILASAELLLIAVTFSEDPHLRSLIRTSLYTKTVDYLAAGKPVIVVSPLDSAEVDYFGAVTSVVGTLEREAFVSGAEASLSSPAARGRVQAGLQLVRQSHTPSTMGQRFLGEFVQDGSDPIGEPVTG